MRIRTKSALLVLGMAALAGLLAGLWLLLPNSPRSESTARAQEIVEHSCSQANTAHSYDVTTRALQFEDDVLITAGTIETRVSGNDHDVVISYDDGAIWELVHVDSVTYIRDRPGPWRIPSGPGWESAYIFISPGALCPQLEGSIARVGEEMVESTSTIHFSESRTTNYGPLGSTDDYSGPTTAETWDFWIDSETQGLLQMKQVHDTPASDWYPADYRAELTSQISGVNEPNIITAPDVS